MDIIENTGIKNNFLVSLIGNRGGKSCSHCNTIIFWIISVFASNIYWNKILQYDSLFFIKDSLFIYG
jgi:hypothetical protein